MPWDNNNDSGGPWGQKPNGPRRPSGGNGGNTPNLEELLSRGREQFGGGGGAGNISPRWWIIGGLVVAVGFWISQSIYQIEANEVGVELLFGQPKEEVSTEGLHFLFWPVETVERVSITQNQTNVASSTNARGATSEGLMLSGDQNIVDVAFTVLWRVSDPQAYLFNVESPDEMVRQVADSAMREVVGQRPASDVFRDERNAIQIEVQEIMQDILDTYGVGVNVAGVTIPLAAPPSEVADAFDEVQRAEQDQDRFQEEARQYSNTLLGQARGQAAQIREEAEAYKDRVVKEAEGEAARFVSVYNEYAKAPDVTRTRLYLETMEEVLGTTNKIILEGGAGGSGVVPYLPLNELRSNNNSSN